MVEPPGTAPGSEPLITRAFIAIVLANDLYIAPQVRILKGLDAGQLPVWAQNL